ncbi:Hypothetical protein I5071_57630 [Sandaracinus amylolyticus]|nr:Hypothetical protein I5071_57630 [Sandaracinus amylolyticus]
MIGTEPIESPRGPTWLSDQFGLMVDASVIPESVAER